MMCVVQYRLISASTQLNAYFACESHKFLYYANKYDAPYLCTRHIIVRITLMLYVETCNHVIFFYQSVLIRYNF